MPDNIGSPPDQREEAVAPDGGFLLPSIHQRQLLSSSDEVKVFKEEGEQDQQEIEDSESLQAELLGSERTLPDEPLYQSPWGHQFGHPSVHMGFLYGGDPGTINPSYGEHALNLQAAYNQQLTAWHQRALPPYYLPLQQNPFLPPHHFPLPPQPVSHVKTEALPTTTRKEPHIKKPLNAFMLFMKEMRPAVQAECTLKESAAINQVLGRRWHNLSRAEQAQYYERAREERAKHLERYPNWTARDSYKHSVEDRQKRKKRKLEKMADPAAGMKKCRARYGVEQNDLWCQPCKRKKKCVRVQMYLASKENKEEEVEEEGLDTFNNPSSGSDADPLSPVCSETSVPSPDGGQNWSVPPIIMRASRVGSDPRDSNNPLSVSSLTNSYRMSTPPT